MPGEDAKPLGEAEVLFQAPFTAFVRFGSPEPDPLSRERDALQLFTLALARTLFLLGSNRQAPMLLQYIQDAMADTVTPEGLKRPSILGPGQVLLGAAPEKPLKAARLTLFQEAQGRRVELALPLGDEGQDLPTVAVFFLQWLIQDLSEASLFFLMLVLGGLMEYYGKIGKTDDLKAISDGPAYAFSAASRYIEEERRRGTPQEGTGA